ncbi:MAG: putative Fe-S cluster assembly protein SufT [Pseudomonadota bacterium]|jgi:probable FeS assembly SUF system protein SufT|nr:putative Fe-S cluster assembly protein SufT [Pseudomonadota bacterium]
MHEEESVVLKRDVNAITIPDGSHVTLNKDQIVTIHQSLGNNYTIFSDTGMMARISGADADALGKETLSKTDVSSDADLQSIENNAWDVMRTVFDPEIPVNIVELGLIYVCRVTPTSADQHRVDITMTLTAAGCGMGPVLQHDVERVVSELPHVEEVHVEVVFDPPWSQDMISEVAKLELGML